MDGTQAAVLMLRGLLSKADEPTKTRITECYDKLRQIVSEYGDEGKFAAGLLGAELAAEIF